MNHNLRLENKGTFFLPGNGHGHVHRDSMLHCFDGFLEIFI